MYGEIWVHEIWVHAWVSFYYQYGQGIIEISDKLLKKDFLYISLQAYWLKRIFECLIWLI